MIEEEAPIPLEDVSLTVLPPPTSEFTIDDDHSSFSLDLPELDDELKAQEQQTQQREKELGELRTLVEKLNRDNKRLTAELAIFHEEEEMSIDDFLGSSKQSSNKLSGGGGSSEKNEKQMKDLSKQLSVAEMRLQSVLTEQQHLMEERDLLRQEFTTAQLDWSCQLKEEQTRIESFKAILRDVEDNAKQQHKTLEIEVERLQQERLTLREKVYEEFSEQVRAKTELVAEFDAKVQQAMTKQNETNQKLILAKQQLEQSTQLCDKQQQSIRDLEKEKEKLLAETHTIRTSLETKCTDLYSTVLQLEHKLKDSAHAVVVAETKSEPDGNLAHLRAKQQLAKGELIKVVGELAEQKRKMMEIETDHRLEINRYKSALNELKKCLKLDAFTFDEEDQSLQMKIQNLQVDDNFGEFGKDVLEDKVIAISSGCERVLSIARNLEVRPVEFGNQHSRRMSEDKNHASDLDNPTNLVQTLRDEVVAIKDNVASMVNCISSLNRFQADVAEHLSCVSTRMYDEATWKTAFKMLLRAFRRCCARSRPRPLSKKHKYAPVQVAGDEPGSP